MEGLRECLWCRGNHEIEVHVNEGGPGWEETWEGIVTCGTCGRGFLTGNYGKGGFTKEMARERTIESWNTRTTDPLMEEMVDALEELDYMFDSTSRVGEIINKALQKYRESTCQQEKK